LKKKICPNLALLAFWRDEYPNPRFQFAKSLRVARKLRVIVIHEGHEVYWIFKTPNFLLFAPSW
jgi:hypothetical protein